MPDSRGAAPPPLPFARGQKFGKWQVIAAAEPVDGETHWLCRCECGAEKAHPAGQLRAHQRLQCRACADAEQAARLSTDPAIAAVRKSLTRPVWPRVCRTCQSPFTGTARQWYCSKACRPK